MPSLQVIKGANEGTVIPLDGEKYILGRNPDCGIVIPVTSVSREHAQILRVQGRYYIEDLCSLNGTFVNGRRIRERTALAPGDTLEFPGLVVRLEKVATEPSVVLSSGRLSETAGPSVLSSLAVMARPRPEVAPEAKLRAVLEIHRALGGEGELNEALNRTLKALFDIFRQAECGFEGVHLQPGSEGERLQALAGESRDARQQRHRADRRQRLEQIHL